MRPAEYLEHCGLLGPNLIAAHCIYCSDEELEILRRTDTTVVSCPRTFSRVGLSAAYARFAGQGIRTVLGTDGYNMDFITEMRAAGLASKLHFNDGGRRMRTNSWKRAPAAGRQRSVATTSAASSRAPAPTSWSSTWAGRTCSR